MQIYEPMGVILIPTTIGIVGPQVLCLPNLARKVALLLIKKQIMQHVGPNCGNDIIKGFH